MRPGIQMILENICRYVRDARILVSDGSIEHAALLAMVAAEELGKASLLYQTLLNGKPKVDLKLFRGREAHKRKMERARQLLGDFAILQSSVFGRARLPFIIGAPDVEASSELRMDCAYVDFRENDWKFGALFPKEHLESLLTKLEEQASLIRSGLSTHGSQDRTSP